MNKKQYAHYENNVNAFFQLEGITNLSMISDEDGHTEPYFSWRACDCCNSSLGGTRYDANGYNPTTEEILEYTVCEDCIYYAEYGRLDDTTMLAVEKDEPTDEDN